MGVCRHAQLRVMTPDGVVCSCAWGFTLPSSGFQYCKAVSGRRVVENCVRFSTPGRSGDTHRFVQPVEFRCGAPISEATMT